MKRCPECEFLYGDEQELCDWDGTRLNFTSFLPPLPPPRVVVLPPKSIWDKFTIPLLVIVLLGSVLVLLYRATPATTSSSSGLPKKTLSREMPVEDKNKLAAPDAPQQLVTAPVAATETAEPSTVASTGTRKGVKKSNRPVPAANEKPVTAPPASHIQMDSPSERKPPTNQTTGTPAAPTIQKPPASSYSISAHPEPPAKPTAQSPSQNEAAKDSKFKSLLKKAGRVLKKPF